MAGEKDTKKSEQITPGAKPDSSTKLSEKDMGLPLDSGSASSGAKGVIEQPSSTEQGVYCSPASCYDYYYPSYNGTLAQSDDKGYFNSSGGSYAGIQSDNASLLYYIPGYGPYPTGFVGVDGKQTFTASKYLQQPSPYGSEAFSCYTYDSTYAGKSSSGSTVKSGSLKSLTTPSGSGENSNGFNHAKTNNYISNKSSSLHFNSKYQQPAPNFSRSTYQNYPVKPLNKLGSGYHSSGVMKEFHPNGSLSSYTGRSPSVYMQQGAVNYHSNGRLWNNTYRPKSRENFGRNREIEYATELTRGPRGDNRNNSSKFSAEVDPTPAIEKKLYNLREFQTKYDDAKFYVIKSYSEDDIHKSIKYGVWSSTPNGNKKLDVAFHEADAKTNELGVKCPVFLFFSVNASGQFIGVAEMIGQVDFSKNMDFWQLDKWSGFFPLKWHVIKDVPNTLLQHISVEANDNKPVTYSRDTQEVGLKQGIEILGIFKNYAEKTSVLNDFNFYENREKSLRAKRAAKQVSHANGFKTADHERQLNSGQMKSGEPSADTSRQSDASSIIGLTKNLTIKSSSAQEHRMLLSTDEPAS